MNECINCGSSKTIPVREGEDDRREPDYIGCKSCSTMVRPHLLQEKETAEYGQIRLEDWETRRLRIGNQHSDHLSIIEWQVVKGAAHYYEVTDWTAKVDSTLTMDENVGLMEQFGTSNNKTTLREMKSPVQYRSRG